MVVPRLLYIRNNLYVHVYIIYDGLWPNGLSVDNFYCNNVKCINSCQQTWTFLSRDTTRNTCSRDVMLDSENGNSFPRLCRLGQQICLKKINSYCITYTREVTNHTVFTRQSIQWNYYGHTLANNSFVQPYYVH